MASVERVQVETSLEAFREVLRADPDYAPAYYEMGNLYMRQMSLQGRIQAHSALKKAIWLDRGNVDYQLALGQLLWLQGFWANAHRHYEKVLELFPESAQASYWVGYYKLKQFMLYKDRARSANLDQWSGYAEEDRMEALSSLNRSIQLDPGFRDAHHLLGLAHYEMDHPQGLVDVSQHLLRQDPSDRHALLFCGLGYQAMGKMKKAHDAYSAALVRMAPSERGTMESIDVLTGEEQTAGLPSLSPVRAGSGRPGVWVEDPERARFWRSQDPLHLTEYNERRMEHYGRVAYANLRFSLPWKGILGWHTDRGKAYIKFGRYLHRSTAIGGVQWVETWHYETFRVSFASVPETGEWYLGSGIGRGSYLPKLEPIRARPGEGWMDAVERMEEQHHGYFRQMRELGEGLSRPSSRHVYEHTPPRFVDPFRYQKHSLPHQVAAFREGDSIRVELAYALPLDRMRGPVSGDSVHVEDGLFLFDGEWKETFRSIKAGAVAWPPPPGLQARPVDSLRGDHLPVTRRVHVTPGHYHAVVEVWSRDTNAIGTFQESRDFTYPDTTLGVSDLLLASRVSARSPLPEGRDDLEIRANPLRTYGRDEPVYVYFEVYDLARDEFGRTDYEISYQVGPPIAEEVDPALFVALDLSETQARIQVEEVFLEGADLHGGEEEPIADYQVRYVLPERNVVAKQIMGAAHRGRGTETGVTARYEGERTDDFTYLQIDVGQMPTGVYKLTVTARDTRPGDVAEKSVLFRTVGEQ